MLLKEYVIFINTRAETCIYLKKISTTFPTRSMKHLQMVHCHLEYFCFLQFSRSLQRRYNKASLSVIYYLSTKLCVPNKMKNNIPVSQKHSAPIFSALTNCCWSGHVSVSQWSVWKHISTLIQSCRGWETLETIKQERETRFTYPSAPFSGLDLRGCGEWHRSVGVNLTKKVKTKNDVEAIH